MRKSRRGEGRDSPGSATPVNSTTTLSTPLPFPFPFPFPFPVTFPSPGSLPTSAAARSCSTIIFSIAAIPGSLILQHRQPLGRERKAVSGSEDGEGPVSDPFDPVNDMEVAVSGRGLGEYVGSARGGKVGRRGKRTFDVGAIPEIYRPVAKDIMSDSSTYRRTEKPINQTFSLGDNTASGASYARLVVRTDHSCRPLSDTHVPPSRCIAARSSFPSPSSL